MKAEGGGGQHTAAGGYMIYESISDLVAERVHDLTIAYSRYVEVLPQVSGGARTDDLRSALDSRIESAREDRVALAALGSELGGGPSGPTSRIMEGFVEQISDILSHEGDPMVREIDLVSTVARLERDYIVSLDELGRHAETLKKPAIRGRLSQARRHAENSERILLKADRKSVV
jgi:ferritin-like metal-binding protein YciE